MPRPMEKDPEVVDLNLRAKAELERRRRERFKISSALSVPDWIEQNFYLYDTGELMTLFPCQREALNEALKRDSETGLYLYSTVIWSWPKKSGKTTVVAAVVDYVAEHTLNGQIQIIANDLKQADNRVGYYLRESIKIAQRKGKRKDITIVESRNKIKYPSGSIVDILPIDPGGEAGGNQAIVVCSELHGWKSKAHETMWSETTLSPTKFGQSQRWVDTYAGESDTSIVLKKLYDEVVISEDSHLRLPSQTGVKLYANPASRMFAVWETQGLFPWHTPAYYREQIGSMTEDEFRRMHKNEWIASSTPFVPIEWWNACRVDRLPALGLYPEVVVALDAAVSGDCFGITAGSRRGRKIELRFARKWSPPKGGVIQYGNTENPEDPNYPEGVVRWLAREFNVVCFTYDPSQLHYMCERLRQENVGYFKPFDQGRARNEADKQLYDLIRDRDIEHTGEPEVAEHIANADKKMEQDQRLRIVKRSDPLKIDLCVCLSMMAYEALKILPDTDSE